MDELLSGLYIGALAIALVWVLAYRKSRSRPPYPPGPPPKPIIGNLLDIPKEKETETYERWYRQHGPIVHVQVMGKHIVILNTVEAVTEVFERRSAIYSGRPQTTMSSDLLHLPEWHFSFRGYDDGWRQRRRLFHSGTHQGVMPKYESLQIRSARQFLKDLSKNSSDLHEVVKRHTGSSIVDVVYGIESNKEHLIKIANEVMGQFEEMLVPGAFLVDIIPALKYIPRWVPGIYFHKFADRTRRLVDEMRSAPMEEVKAGMAAGKAQVSMASELLDGNVADQDVMDVTSIAYTAGSDTSVSSILAFLLAMANYPTVQAKAQAEIDSVVGNNRLPEFSDRANLPFVNALILEVWRWQPVGPIGAPHESTDDDEYSGYFIPKGSIVMGNVWSILHDPDNYANPEEFRPERFLKQTTDGKLEIDKSVMDPTTFAFGSGRRICPGRYLADQMVYASVVSILAAFSVQPVPNEKGQRLPLKVAMSDGIVSHPLPFDCDIKPRSARAIELIGQPLPERGL